MSLRGKVFSYPESFRSLKILIAAKYGDHDLSLDPAFVFGRTNLSQEWLAKFPLGKVPGVELSGGQTLDESNSAAWLLCPENMTGGGDKNSQSSILRWISLADLEVTPAACNWVYPRAGLMPASPDMERGRADLLRFLTWLNTELRLRTWLVTALCPCAPLTCWVNTGARSTGRTGPAECGMWNYILIAKN